VDIDKKAEQRPIEILIAEDSPTQAEQLKHILEKHSYKVYHANNGKEAVALLKNLKPALIISDIVMPEMNGYELCKTVKSDESTKDILVILLTTLSDTRDVIEGLACGADYFITKPYREGYLLSHIEQALTNNLFYMTERARINVDIPVAGRTRSISMDPQQMLTMLISTYESAIDRNTELVRTQEELSKINDHLEELVVERTIALTNEITERKRAEEELRKHKDNLEEIVKERTLELEASNHELEAFAYSVSHDLRAPLRGIDGFSQALLDDYGDRIDATASDYLRRIRAGSQRMGLLIDDLLKLSRVTRSEIVFKMIDLSSMVREITDELVKTAPNRKAEFVIQNGVKAVGDPRLLRVALENLLGNSWKYTSKHPTARIEFGIENLEEGMAYFIKDDGAGFDIAYVDKLFSPFQRLHSADDFPGTGIGLATVQRIIRKHGGWVWAEAAIEKGATMHFTLPRLKLSKGETNER
jgi:two-component system, sensor histidine kinase and response regulator